MLQHTGNLNKAITHIQKAMQELNQSSLPHNLLKAKAICRLGIVFHSLASQATGTNYTVLSFTTWYYRYKAEKQLNTALDIMRKVHNDHPNTATILAAIGRLELDSDDLYAAKLDLLILKQNVVDRFIQTLPSITSCWQKSLVKMEMSALPSLTHKKLTRSTEP